MKRATIKYVADFGIGGSEALGFPSWGDTPIADISSPRVDGLRRVRVFETRTADFEAACVRAGVSFRRYQV